MLVKKLRRQRNWSQEQLAEMSGLSVRTVQRIESGNRASLETLKCLAAVFEVELSVLTEKITLIDKESDNWKALPWWYRYHMFGVDSRMTALFVEFLFLGLAVVWAVLWVLSDGSNAHVVTVVCLLAAYVQGWFIRFGDRRGIW